MDQLAAMQSFVEVVDRGGFAPAARCLGLSGPMVGNHVRYLEARLGGLLLIRTTRAQQLTELGQLYLGRCRTVLTELAAAEADAAELTGTPRGVIRVTAPHTIGSVALPPVIARFVRENPAVIVDLHLDDRRLDLLAGRFDVALRVGHLDDAGLVTRALAPLELVVCAAPRYLAGRGEPAQPADLAAHDCLDFAASGQPGTWRFSMDGQIVEVPVSGPLQANSGAALRQAALEGVGIILQPKLLVREDIEAGRLRPLLAACRPEGRPLQVLTHPDRQPTPKLRAFVGAVVRDLGARAEGR